MFNIFSTAKSGLSAYQGKLDYLSNDLVNSTTTGYKASDVGFRDMMTQTLDRKGVSVDNKEAVNGTGVRLGNDFRNNTQGSLLQTGLTTDLAIDGEGYFGLQGADGQVLYTRDGNFKIDTDGQLVTADGTRVMINYENGFSAENVKLNPAEMSVDSEGGISVKMDNEYVLIGKIPVFTAEGDKAFIAQGNSTFIASDDAQVKLSTDYDIRQGMLEGSNVDISEVFTDVILTQRAFQLASKAMTAADDLWSMVNQMRS